MRKKKQRKPKLVGYYKSARTKNPTNKVYRSKGGKLFIKKSRHRAHPKYIQQKQKHNIHFYKRI
jgi:hypothetical protein